MKISKSLHALALLLAFGPTWAGAAPAAIEASVPVDVASAEEIVTTAVSSKADCAAVDLSTPSWLGDPEMCGQCSLDPCVGKEVGYVCGAMRTCQSVGLCIEDGTPLCRCRPALAQ